METWRGSITCPWLHGFVLGWDLNLGTPAPECWTGPPSLTAVPRIFFMFQRIQVFPFAELTVPHRLAHQFGKRRRAQKTWLNRGQQAFSVVPGQSSGKLGAVTSDWSLCHHPFCLLYHCFCLVRETKGSRKSLGDLNED